MMGGHNQASPMVQNKTADTEQILSSLPGYGEVRAVQGDGFKYEAFFSTVNSRIRVLNYAADDADVLTQNLDRRARQQQMGKILIKCPADDAARFVALGFVDEALIYGYFNGVDAALLSRIVDPARNVSFPSETVRTRILTDAQQAVTAPITRRKLLDGITCRIATPNDAHRLSALFLDTFESYPFPVFDPAFIVQGMQTDVVYLLLEKENELVAVASAEMVPALNNAELTDFATAPRYRGNGCAAILLARLETEMAKRGVSYLYTLARASSPSINRIFAKAGYRYTGTLVKNCHIGGKFEDMNCWCKPKQP